MHRLMPYALLALLAGCGEFEVCHADDDCPEGATCLNGTCSAGPGLTAVDGEVGLPGLDTYKDTGTPTDAPPDGAASAEIAAPACGRAAVGCAQGAALASFGENMVRCPDVVAGPVCGAGWHRCSTAEAALQGQPADPTLCCTTRPPASPCCLRFGADCPESHGFRCDVSAKAPICLSDDGSEVWVPGGQTLVGCDPGGDPEYCSPNERPARLVTVPPFAIDRTEITAAAWLDCLAYGTCPDPLSFDGPGARYDRADEGFPATNLTWLGAAVFCSWRHARLPSESEWETAAKGACDLWCAAGDQSCCVQALAPFPWGPTPPTCSHAVLSIWPAGGKLTVGCGLDGPGLVGARPEGASPYGALDMSGNAWEWVRDCAAVDHTDLPLDGSPRVDCDTSFASTARGGGFMSRELDMRVTRRQVIEFPDQLGWDFFSGAGGRCARSLRTAQSGCAGGLEEALGDTPGIAGCATDGDPRAWNGALDTEVCAPGWRVCTVSDLRQRTPDADLGLTERYHLSEGGGPDGLSARWSGATGQGGCAEARGMTHLSVGGDPDDCAPHPACGDRGCAPTSQAQVEQVLCCVEGTLPTPEDVSAGVVVVDDTPGVDALTTGRGLAALPGGGFVAAWSRASPTGVQDRNIFQRRFRADGRPAGPVDRVDSGHWGRQEAAAVATLAWGGWVAVWQSQGQDSNAQGWGIIGRVYTPEGGPARGEIHVNYEAVGNQHSPAVTGLALGQGVAVWVSEAFDGVRNAIAYRLITPFGDPVDRDVLVVDTLARVDSPAVTWRPEGGFVVAWTEDSGGQLGDIMCRIYDGAGQPTGPARAVNGTQAGEQNGPALATLLDGRVVVAWRSVGQDGSGLGVFARTLKPSDGALGPEVRLNETTAGDQSLTDLMALPEGGFLAVWGTATAGETTSRLVRRRFSADGQPTSAEEAVDADGEGAQRGGTAALMAGGEQAVLWFSAAPDAEGFRPLARRWARDGSPLPVGARASPDCSQAGAPLWCLWR